MGWGSGNLGGGSGGLNFKVIGGLTQPANLKENSIWVITDVPITAWTFSPTEPEPPADGKDGPVWFRTGTSSQVAFNALKKNVVELHPMSAKQYIGGAWVDVEAQSYQDGEWVDWLTYIYNKGDQCTDITGGWSVVSENGSYWTNGVVEYNADHIRLYNSASKRISMTATENKIDLSNITEICVDVESLTGGDKASLGLIASAERASDASFDVAVAAAVTSITAPYSGKLMLDVSTLDGSYYIALNAYTMSGASEAIISEVWMR